MEGDEGGKSMSEITTEPGRWLLDEYRRTPGDPKWHPGMGLESSIIAIEVYAAADALRALREEIEQMDWTDTQPRWGDDITLDSVLAAIDRRLA
jgi:hypothetical protein